jgi:hypothetical protein
MAKVGDVRGDGKVYTGPTYGWQSPGTVWKRTPGKAGEEKTIGGVTKVYTGPKYGWQTKETIKSRQQPAKPDSRLDSPVAGKGPKGNEVGSKPSTQPAAQPPATPSPAPSPTPSGSGGGGGGSASRPAPTPAPAAPKPSPVAAYMTAAAKARKSGDPAEMAKVRDMGMDIWRKSNPKLAAAADERARIRGTSQTDNPLMKDMRGGLPVTPTVQAPAVKDLGSGQQSLSQNKFAGRSPEPAKPAPTPTPKVTISTDKQMSTTADALSKNPIKKEVKKEAYDVVLDYLLSEGHADTLSEAHYVMLQMDAEHIQNIIEAPGEWFGGLRDRARASRAAQMQSSQPTPKPLPSSSSPFAKPASRNDSGKLTTYGAGGGAAAERAGQTRTQVMQQGAKNLENKKSKPVNQGPDFGR